MNVRYLPSISISAMQPKRKVMITEPAPISRMRRAAEMRSSMLVNS